MSLYSNKETGLDLNKTLPDCVRVSRNKLGDYGGLAAELGDDVAPHCLRGAGRSVGKRERREGERGGEGEEDGSVHRGSPASGVGFEGEAESL